MKFLRVLFPLAVIRRRVLAFPLSYSKSTVIAAKTRVPLIVIAISLFLVLVTIKLVYMKLRRIRTIHAQPSIPIDSNLSFTTSSFESRDDACKHWHRALWVGCLGSPTWETNLTARLDRATWRREQRRSPQWQTGSSMPSTRTTFARTKSKDASSSSRLTKSTVVTSCSINANQFILPLSSGYSWITGTTVQNGSSSRSLGSVQRHTCYPRCGDFGETYGVRSVKGSVPRATRRASPSSIRLVDGPSHSNQVEYSFLSGLPPDAIVVSSLMGTRDSFQLSRCSLKCNRKAVPPLPPLPLFLPFHLPKDCEALESYCPKVGGHLPQLRFSPLVSVANVFHSQQQALERSVSSGQIPNPDESKSASPKLSALEHQHASTTGPLTSSFVVQDTPPLHLVRKTDLRSSNGLTIGIEESSPRTTLVAVPTKESMGILRAPSGASLNSSVGSKKPLKSCLRRTAGRVYSPESMFTPLISETSTGRSTASDHASLWTPMSEVDIGILGLDQFHWSDDDDKEIRMRSCHLKKDSVASIPYWV